MFLTIGGMLDAASLAHIRETASKLDWRDGAATAGATAKRVKRNVQADLSSAAGQNVIQDVMSALAGNTVFMAAARPAKYSPLMLSKTGTGGGYGTHADNAVMGQGVGRLRTDLSFTLFLSDPETYDGGALMLDLAAGTQALKPAAGDLVLYPSTLLHAVEPVTSGERLAIVGWVQSQLRNADQRRTLFDLERVRAGLRANPNLEKETLLLDKVVSNLLRQWVEL